MARTGQWRAHTQPNDPGRKHPPPVRHRDPRHAGGARPTWRPARDGRCWVSPNLTASRAGYRTLRPTRPRRKLVVPTNLLASTRDTRLGLLSPVTSTSRLCAPTPLYGPSSRAGRVAPAACCAKCMRASVLGHVPEAAESCCTELSTKSAPQQWSNGALAAGLQAGWSWSSNGQTRAISTY